MCMVGYILGLGDRHGENILFDATCGDCVHVDFNCLFKKVSLKMVPQFATAHMFCASRGDPRNPDFFRTAPTNSKVFLRG